MRMLLIYILFVAFGCQQTTFLETENLKTSKSEKGLRANDKGQKSESRKVTRSQGRKDAGAQSSEAQSSQLEVQNTSQVFNFSDSQIQKNNSQFFRFSVSQIQYYESQIRLADSLYKNYLPQYNFDEVKAAMEFFDSLTADNRQQSTDNRLRARKTKCTEDTRPCVSTGEKGCYPRTVDCCPLTVDIEYQRARAHYYHAVGLTERDDIVGACEHYFIALEIMESETENLKTSKYRKGSEQRAMSHEQKFRNAHSSKLEAQSPDYEKIRFLSLIYTRLGQLFYDENYCDMAILQYSKALECVEILGNNDSKAYILKFLGNSYQLANKSDNALHYYNESLRYNSNLPNKLDVEKSIAQILIDKGERDSAYMLLKNNLYKKIDILEKLLV